MTTDNLSDTPNADHIELSDRYIEVGCPQCGHPFEIDLMEWVSDAQR